MACYNTCRPASCGPFYCGRPACNAGCNWGAGSFTPMYGWSGFGGYGCGWGAGYPFFNYPSAYSNWC